MEAPIGAWRSGTCKEGEGRKDREMPGIRVAMESWAAVPTFAF